MAVPAEAGGDVDRPRAQSRATPSKLARDLTDDIDKVLDGGCRLALAPLQEADGSAGKWKCQVEGNNLSCSHFFFELGHRAKGDLVGAEQQLADQGVGARLHRTLRPPACGSHKGLVEQVAGDAADRRQDEGERQKVLCCEASPERQGVTAVDEASQAVSHQRPDVNAIKEGRLRPPADQHIEVAVKTRTGDRRSWNLDQPNNEAK